ncbi:hypothetical protein C5S32_08120 [ANME-1 cluster archaeon GoMg1]|nr:hypothetical protein [ANME-1 cluster archaeon GoMg1]
MTNYLKTDLTGKVNNLKHFKNEALLPLFEAIVNSIEAIEERGNSSKGQITVRLIRNNQQALPGMDIDEAQKYIIVFEIGDNGIGFDDNNYDSFQTAETTYKMEKGGKGVGRFFWLKAFDKVEIESVYSKDADRYLRKIEFTLNNGITEKVNSLTDKPQKTIVKLIGFKRKYQDQPSAYKKGETIAQRILEHCISYLIGGTTIKITLIDGDDNYSINERFEEIKQNIIEETIIIKDHEFSISHLKLYSTYLKMHKIVLTANNREVKSFDISKLLGTTTQFDEDGSKFVYSVYVSSPYLDKRVDSSRMEFNIPETPGTLDVINSPISIEEIKKGVTERSRVYLSKYLEIIDQQKKENVHRFVSKENPALRAVPTYCPELYYDLEYNSSDEKINEILYKYKGKTEYEIKKQSNALLKTQPESISEIEDTYKETVDKLEAFQKDQLAGYMILRKMIIELLDKKLQLNEEGKYPNEDIIHDIIIPRKRTTDELRYEDHNLWLIDERLTFHELASSDIPLSNIITSGSTDRPDVVVFSETDDDRIAKAVSIIELKKPQRESFNDNRPTEKVLDYVRLIRDNKVKLQNGRPLEVNETTRFYCYVVCDITDEIKKFAEDGNFATLKGERGYYLYNQKLNTHIEIIAFDKIIIDVKQRHKAFFEKLGIDLK